MGMKHVIQNFIRRVEAKGGRVPNIELEDLVAFFLQAPRFLQHWTPNVIADVAQFVGLGNGVVVNWVY